MSTGSASAWNGSGAGDMTFITTVAAAMGTTTTAINANRRRVRIRPTFVCGSIGPAARLRIPSKRCYLPLSSMQIPLECQSKAVRPS